MRILDQGDIIKGVQQLKRAQEVSLQQNVKHVAAMDDLQCLSYGTKVCCGDMEDTWVVSNSEVARENNSPSWSQHP